MTGQWTTSTATRLLEIELPIVLGAFGGASSAELVAAVSNAGGLGSYGLYGLGPDAIASAVASIRERTQRPFALNLWLPGDLDDPWPNDDASFERALEPLLPYFAELGIGIPERPQRYLVPFDEQLDPTIDAHPAALSFVYGVPDPDIIDRCHTAGIAVIGTATTVHEAMLLDGAGVDAIIATGSEAAGHRVSFARPAEESLVGTMALVPRVVDAVNVPVIAAGGIADGRGVAAALTLGAGAAQIGTAFLACDESAANAPHRAALWDARAEDTTLTRAFSGRLARGIPNKMSRELSDAPIAPFPMQNWLTSHLKRAAATAANRDFTSLWAGQAAPLIRHRRAVDLIDAIVAQVDTLLP